MYDKDNDIDRIFITDSREKKRVAVGIHNRASRKRGFKGGVRTQSDYLTAKQKKLLNGEVKVYSMFDEYKDLEKCDLNEILKKSDNDIKNILTVIKNNNTCGAIYKRFKISNGKLYGLYQKYGVEYEKKPRIKKNTKLSTMVITKERFELMNTIAKGEYITKACKDHKITITQLAHYWGLQVSSLKYFKHRYTDNLRKKNDEIEVKQVTFEPKPVEEVVQPIIVDNSKEEELNKHIEELEKELEKLKNNIVANVSAPQNGLRLNINGDYSKEELGDRLLSIDNITTTGRKYKISFILEEI